MHQFHLGVLGAPSVLAGGPRTAVERCQLHRAWKVNVCVFKGWNNILGLCRHRGSPGLCFFGSQPFSPWKQTLIPPSLAWQLRLPWSWGGQGSSRPGHSLLWHCDWASALWQAGWFMSASSYRCHSAWIPPCPTGLRLESCRYSQFIKIN